MRFGLDFLLHLGFRTDKHIRGPLLEWVNIFGALFGQYEIARTIFRERLEAQPSVFAQLLLECTNAEIRTCFASILREYFFHAFARETPDAAQAIVGHIFADRLLPLLEKVTFMLYLTSIRVVILAQEVGANWKRFGQYFKVLADYADLGLFQRQQLLALGVLQNSVQFILKQNFTSKFHRPDLRFALEFNVDTTAYHSSSPVQPFRSAGWRTRAVHGSDGVPGRLNH